MRLGNGVVRRSVASHPTADSSSPKGRSELAITTNYNRNGGSQLPMTNLDASESKERRGNYRGILRRYLMTFRQRRMRYTRRTKGAQQFAFGTVALLFTLVIGAYMHQKSNSVELRYNVFNETPYSSALLLHPLSRPRSATAIPILITTIQREKSETFQRPPQLDPDVASHYSHVDYGEVELSLLEDEGAVRVIYHNWDEDEGEVRDYHLRDDDVDQYYAFDDDYARNTYVRVHSDENMLRDQKRCRRVSWHRLRYPTCNDFHEMDTVSNVPTYLSIGGYREVFIHDDKYLNKSDKIVWKQIIYSMDVKHDNFEFVRMDALVAERLTSNPRIVNVYGLCGLSLLSEYFPHGDIEGDFVSGYVKETDLRNHKELQPLNSHISVRDKLQLALEMSQAVAVLHGYEGGVIVHDDIQASQFLYSAEGNIKLNDFNRAEIMLWDEENKDYCWYGNGPGNGNFRAPEEYKDILLNEKIDVWSLGNIIYALLTGVWVQYEDEEMKDFKTRIMNGITSYVDERYRTNSVAERRLVEIMERCWVYDPNERASVFEVVKWLQEAIVENDKIEGRKKN